MDQKIWELIMNHYRVNLGVYTVVTPKIARLYEGVRFEDLTRLLSSKFPEGFAIKYVVPSHGHVLLDSKKRRHKMIPLEELGYELVDGKYVLMASER